ncbi:MAG TPA: HNH endonuclease [Solirubrobacteraceae bacterium]|nr:HNH endonuclease [Solirubrobacteraceae bacterium]
MNKNGPVMRPGLTPCWECSGYHDRDGRAYMRVGSLSDGTRRKEGMHRVAFFVAHGRWPEPDGCHTCDNPGCCNPDHVFEGTHLDNMADMRAKGRSCTGERHWANRRPEAVPRGEAHPGARLTVEQVMQIRAADGSRTEIAEQLGVSAGCVDNARSGKTWAHVPGAVPRTPPHRRLVEHEGETLTVTVLARRHGLPPWLVAHRLDGGWSVADALRPGDFSPAHLVTANGETLTLSEWARRLGLSQTAVRGRLQEGWDPVRAVTTPRRPGGPAPSRARRSA